MARPTEPGWYWLREGDGWSIVAVGLSPFVGDDIVEHVSSEDYTHVRNYADDQWGGRITQEPAPDPPPPF